MNTYKRSLNISVMPEYPQSEGGEHVLNNLIQRTGATSITTSPYVMEPSDALDAGREPPADAKAGAVRLLDRELWGKRELTVRTAPSFVPDKGLYQGLRYQPSEPDALTKREGPRISAFIDETKARGLNAYMQVQSAIPPGYKVQFGGAIPEDRPLLPDGSEHEGRVDKNASLASPHIKAYGCALLRDIIQTYPNLDGLRVDWPEYPPYSFDSLFFDFSGHAKTAAQRLGYDFERMRSDTDRLRTFLLQGLANYHIDNLVGTSGWHVPWIEGGGGDFDLGALGLDASLGSRLLGDTQDREEQRGTLWDLLKDYPGVLDLRAFKADLVAEMLDDYAKTVADASGGKMDFVVQGFPPPWSQASGFDVKKIAPHVSGIGVKLYTMHWPMMVRAYADRILASNGNVPENVLLIGIFTILDLLDKAPPSQVRDVAYPEPDEPHLAGLQAQARKIHETRSLAGETPVYAFSHAYGPVDDYRARMEVAWEASGHRMVVNRYGYMSDQKLDILGDVTGAEK